jgi:hypothetical protein
MFTTAEFGKVGARLGIYRPLEAALQPIYVIDAVADSGIFHIDLRSGHERSISWRLAR